MTRKTIRKILAGLGALEAAFWVTHVPILTVVNLLAHNGVLNHPQLDCWLHAARSVAFPF